MGEQLLQAQSLVYFSLGTGLPGFSKDWIIGFSDFGFSFGFSDINTNWRKVVASKSKIQGHSKERYGVW